MSLERLSLLELIGGWTAVFVIALTPFALAGAPNDLGSIRRAFAQVAGEALICATWFAVPMWGIIRIAS